MFIKETKNGVVVGLQTANTLPVNPNYSYVEITEAEYLAIRAEWAATLTPVVQPTQEERLSALEEAVLGLMGV